MKVKLLKLLDLPDALHPNNIAEGFEVSGTLYKEPKVGESFMLGNFYTSTVQKIIDENIFQTHNSIYQIVREK